MKRDYYLRHVCLSVRLSGRLEKLLSHWTETCSDNSV